MPFRSRKNEDLRSSNLCFEVVITSFWPRKNFFIFRMVLNCIYSFIDLDENNLKKTKFYFIKKYVLQEILGALIEFIKK